MRARSAVFDLYGDHLLARDSWAPVAGLVDLLGAVDINPPTTRTAVSRMVREGWLAADTRDGARGYAATARAQRRLSDSWQRIYALAPRPWDGRWDMVVLGRLPDRSHRARVAASLEFLGYAQLSAQTWIAPHASSELAEALQGVPHDRFTGARLDGEPAALVARLWDLKELTRAHERFLRWSANQVQELGTQPSPRAAYATRTQVVHEWRKFLFRDPALPPDVLPQDWLGATASREFVRIAGELEPAADSFVTACLTLKETR